MTTRTQQQQEAGIVTEIEEVPIKPPRNPRRAALLVLGIDELAGLLDLPEGMHPTFIYAEPFPGNIKVVVQGADLPEIPYGTEPPAISGTWIRRQWRGPDGRVYRRFGWERDEDPRPTT